MSSQSPTIAVIAPAGAEEMLAIQASILDHLSDGVTATDVAGRITYVSPSVHALLGYRPEERIGRPIEQAYQRAEMALERAPRCGCTWHDGRERWA